MLKKLITNLSFLFLLIFLGLSNLIKAQILLNNYSSKISLQVNQEEEINPLLINGKPYLFYSQKNIEGDPLLNSTDFLLGQVVIKNNIFNNILLNLDLYNQDVLLKYFSNMGSVNIIRLSKAWLRDFQIGNQSFIISKKDEFPQRVYQVIGKDSLQIYYYLFKTLELVDDVRGPRYIYIQKRICYLLQAGHLHEYSSNRNFARLFDDTKRSLIKNFIKENRINVKVASDLIMEQLINFCNTH